MMDEACHIMNNDEILNNSQKDFPLFQAKLYGDKILTAKFSKRISCAIKHLPLRVQFHFEYSIIKAVEAGIIKDPTLVLDDKIFIEGLSQTEIIVDNFQELLRQKGYDV